MTRTVVLAARFFASESSSPRQASSRRSPDRRQMTFGLWRAGSITIGRGTRSPDEVKRNPGTTKKLHCRSRISPRSIRATKKIRKKGSRTPKGAVQQPPQLASRRAPCRARTPSGVPPRLSSKGLAHPKDSAPDQASRSAAPKRHQAAGYPRQRRPRLQRAPRVPVIMPADMMSEPPGSKGDEPLPAGTALAPPDGVTGRRPCKRASQVFLVRRAMRIQEIPPSRIRV